MTIIDFNSAAAAAPVAPFKVDARRGTSNDTVSRQWISRPADQKFLSLSDLYASVKARADASEENVVYTKKVEFFAPDPATRDTHGLKLGLQDGTELNPNHWSFNQLCSLVKAPSSYLRTLPSQIVADNLSYNYRFNKGADFRKTYASDGNLLAITGQDYGRIFDLEVVDAVQQIAGNGTGDERWKVPGVLDWRTGLYNPHTPITTDTTTLFASDRDVFIFLVDDLNPIEIGKLPDGSPDYVFRGFYVSNSEVGSSSLRLGAFLLRAVCANRILWGVSQFEEVTLRHTKYAPTRFIEEARPALESFADGSTRGLLEGVEKAKSAVLAKTQDEAIEFLQARSFSRKKAIEILAQGEEEEGQPVRNAWQFVQAITANARSIPNNDGRVEVEQIAGKIMKKVTA